jgi:predicted GIY-YIG superfamily endonuclease
MKDLIRQILVEERKIKWTEDAIKDVALTYNTKSEFKTKSPRAYEVAKSKGNDFYNSITSHMKRESKYSDENLRDIAKKYNRRKEFFDSDGAAYQAAKKKGETFFNDITSHMEDGRAFQEIKWTDELLKKITSEYNKLSDFRSENPPAYAALLRRGNDKYNEYTSHMEKRREPYTDDELKQIALKYNNYTDFTKNDGGAQVAARNRGKDFYDEITKHFINKPYTYDEVKQIALKYDRIGDLQKNDRRAYSAARTNGWFDDVTSHMLELQHNWTYDEVKNIAFQYPTKKEWRDGNSKSYSWALSNLSPEEYDEITTHMEPLGNMANRMIYSFEFPDKAVYVGLTFNSKKRFNQHLNSIKSAVNKYIQETGLTPIFKKHTDYISKEDAIKMEGQIEDQYRQNGWKILNIAKTGALGSSILKWTFDEVQKEALKYKTRTEFENKNGSAYQAARKRGWLDDVTKHMTLLRPQRYTDEELKDIAKKYNNIKDFEENDYGAYQAAHNRGIYKDITKHIQRFQNKWTSFESVKNEALKYKTIKDFRKHSLGAYKRAHKNGWLKDVTKHMVRPDQTHKWTYDNLKKEAQKYLTKKDFLKSNSSAYQTAYRKGYLSDFFPE